MSFIADYDDSFAAALSEPPEYASSSHI